MIWLWLEAAFATLPGCNDDLFRGLWLERRLRFGDQAPDAITEYSARLVCAALKRRTRLLIVLPDTQVSRPAFLFATALIRSWYDCQTQKSSENGSQQQKILYFGSEIRFREQLSQVNIKNNAENINLSDFFRQQDIMKGQREIRRARKSQIISEDQLTTLPEVITVYAPADPIAILKEYKPQWIAIDCGDANHLRWLEPLLKWATEKQLPVLGWGQNPLSESVAEFCKYGHVFTWISQPKLVTTSSKREEENLETYLSPNRSIQIRPIILEGTSAQTLATYLHEASQLLARSFESTLGNFAKDAIRVHWKYLRALESLSVPLEFYEAEAPHFWGLKSLRQLSAECEHFCRACNQNNVNLATKLEQVHTSLQAATEYIRNSGSPLWQVLCNLVVNEPSAEEARLLIFSSRARKELFLLALLANYSFTEEDLHTLRTWVVSLDELRRLRCTSSAELIDVLTVDPTLYYHLMFIGLPSPLLIPKLLPVLSQQNVDFLLYSHQISTLAYQSTDWGNRLAPRLSDTAVLLGQLSGRKVPKHIPSLPPMINLAEPLGINAGNIAPSQLLFNQPLWQPNDPVSEIAWLLEAEETLSEDELSTGIRFQADSEIESEQQSWCEAAIEVKFDAGWRVCLAPDDQINVIVTGEAGQQVDKRYVRSLRVGDRVVVIPEQRRQCLYDLILSRIHGHPSIELHLALIRQWQKDLQLAYGRWQSHGLYNLDQLLWQMRQRGSRLTHPMTLRAWLVGNILCPEDVEDLRRVADILDMDFVRTHYRRIYKAAKRLRGLHRVLARRLNRWLEEQASGSATSHDDDVIDAELGITFSDFRNSLLILRVQNVTPITGLFLRSSLGRFERTNQE